MRNIFVGQVKAANSQPYRQSLAGQNPILFTPDAAGAAGPW